MKHLLLLILFVLFVGCSNTNGVFWCGDHACANKKEKEAYYAKTLIVEIKQKNKKNKKKLSNVEIIEKEYGLNQEDEKKQKNINQKISKKKEKNKKSQLEIEKEIEKQIILDEKKMLKEKKRILKEEKKLSKKIKKEKKIKKKNDVQKLNLSKSMEFDNLAKSIIKKNKSKSFPDINDIN